VEEVVYRFELRRAEDVVATGHVNWEEPLEVGDSITIGRRQGIIRTIEPLLGEQEMRLVVQLLRDH